MNRRFCSRCLLYEGIRFWLHPRTLPDFARKVAVQDGVCSVCRAFERWRSPRLQSREAAQVRDSPIRRAVLLLSGGKDSSAMLAFVRLELQFEVTAVLLDNGLIPEPTLSGAARLCESLATPLKVVRRHDLELSKAIGADQPTPCIVCAQNAIGAALPFLETLATPWLFQGTNYFAAWNPVPVGLRRTSHAGQDVWLTHVPFVFGFKSSTVSEWLARVDCRPASDLPGVTSNCRLPGMVQEKVATAIGHVPELEDLSLEVMVGHLTRDQALEELWRKAPQHRGLLPLTPRR